MMQVKVRMLGPLALDNPAYARLKRLEIKEGISIKDLCLSLGLLEHEIYNVSVNGKLVDNNYQICHGDEITLIPAVFGG